MFKDISQSEKEDGLKKIIRSMGKRCVCDNYEAFLDYKKKYIGKALLRRKIRNTSQRHLKYNEELSESSVRTKLNAGIRLFENYTERQIRDIAFFDSREKKFIAELDKKTGKVRLL